MYDKTQSSPVFADGPLLEKREKGRTPCYFLSMFKDNPALCFSDDVAQPPCQRSKEVKIPALSQKTRQGRGTLDGL